MSDTGIVYLAVMGDAGRKMDHVTRSKFMLPLDVKTPLFMSPNPTSYHPILPWETTPLNAPALPVPHLSPAQFCYSSQM
jgi:hypothetical protein